MGTGPGASGSKLDCCGDGVDGAAVAVAGAGAWTGGSRRGATVVGSDPPAAGSMGAGDAGGAGIAIGGVTTEAARAAGVG
jgi:hypothetical protein